MPSSSQSRAWWAGLVAAAVFALGSGAVMLLTVLLFRFDPEQAVAVVVLETALFGLTSRNTFLGISRLVEPRWPVDRLAYTTSSVSIDGQRHSLSTPSHLVGSTWSRPFSLCVLLLWWGLSAVLAMGFLAFGWSAGLRSFG